MLAPLSPAAALSDVICSNAEYRSWRAELPLSAAALPLGAIARRAIRCMRIVRGRLGFSRARGNHGHA